MMVTIAIDKWGNIVSRILFPHTHLLIYSTGTHTLKTPRIMAQYTDTGCGYL